MTFEVFQSCQEKRWKQLTKLLTVVSAETTGEIPSVMLCVSSNTDQKTFLQFDFDCTKPTFFLIIKNDT